MTDQAKFQRVPLEDQELENGVGIEGSVTAEETLKEAEGSSFGGALEIGDDIHECEIQQGDDYLLSCKDQWFLSSILTVLFAVPILLLSILLLSSLFGSMWPASLFSVHLSVLLWNSWSLIPKSSLKGQSLSNCRRIILVVVDSFLFGFVYTMIWAGLIQVLFVEPDGTHVIEYTDYIFNMKLLQGYGVATAVLRALIECTSICCSCQSCCSMLPRSIGTVASRTETCGPSWPPAFKTKFQSSLRRLILILGVLSLGILSWCLVSLVISFGTLEAPAQRGPECDPLDETECMFPFPSSFYLVPDENTTTGFRVNLSGDAMPPLKGGRLIDPSFLNGLDGFSTMASLLFYIPGMKEAAEAPPNPDNDFVPRLQGPQNISQSITSKSITLLLDVEAQELVPHSAEIDYLDPDRPSVMVFPALALNHNKHYALAVYGATDVRGDLIPRTPGMNALFAKESSDPDRLKRMRDVVLPSLENAASWVKGPEEYIQLLFDFHTISASSQLGPAKAARSATVATVSGSDWGKWENHVSFISAEEGTCEGDGGIARTIYAALDVPWFLDRYGPGARDATLSQEALRFDGPLQIGQAKFVVHVPCSLRSAALGEGDEHTELRAFMEFGHGLFYHRAEASSNSVVQLANENGYIIMAMDWRGMSAFDLIIVFKTLTVKPSLFQSLRDNLIQGYASKIALQHFARNGMLDMPWLKFGPEEKPIPTYGGKRPTSVFYGISQGGILGAGYTSLAGPTGLIDRGILGVPGTPFTLAMSRSSDFVLYDDLALLTFYNNRHVRLAFAVVQMAWDPAEGSGMLAPPVNLKVLPRMLLQAGLGDDVVPTIAAEALARSYGASVLPNNPRTDIYGIPVEPAAAGDSLGPRVTLTELLFKREYASLVDSDKLSPEPNSVHYCVRHDPAMLAQIAEFVNSGRVIDPCENDGCVREFAHC